MPDSLATPAIARPMPPSPELLGAPGPELVRPSRRGSAGTSDARRRMQRAMKLVRRAHLYSGLVLVPFVVLYGVTGWLFNHPDHFGTRDAESLPRAEVEARGLAPFAAPAALATALVDALNVHRPAAVPWQLVASDEPRFTGSFELSRTGDGRTHSVVVDAASGAAELRTRVRRERAAVQRREIELPLELPEVERARAAAGALLDERGLTGSGRADRVRAPHLAFTVAADGALFAADYDLGDRRVVLRPVEQRASAMTARDFLLRLHTTHTYPLSSVTARWLWAVVVDVISVAMVTWAVTGCAMWWQIRALRRVGGIALVAGAVLMALLASGMWTHVTR